MNLLRKKHIFIGSANVLAHWIAEFPDLINDVAVLKDMILVVMLLAMILKHGEI